MKGKMVLLIAVMVLSLGLVGTPASWANSLTFQNVTFDLSLSGSNLLLRVTNALNATGSWLGIETLNAFQINNYGTASNLSASGGGVTWNTVPGGLNAGANGCGGTGGGTCFNTPSPFMPLSNDFTLTVTKGSGAFNLTIPDQFGVPGPHLKVFFGGADQGDGHGSLLSATVPAPEPSSLMLLGAAFAGLGIWRRKAIQI